LFNFYSAPLAESTFIRGDYSPVLRVPRAVSCPNFIPFDFHPSLRDSPTLVHSFLKVIPSNGCIVFLDTETTGLSENDRVIEVAFILRNYHTMLEKRWYSLINPLGQKSGSMAMQAHKIPDRALICEKPFSDLADSIMHFIDDHLLIAHNVAFDRRMLNSELARLSLPLLCGSRFECTLKLARQINRGEKNNLSAVCERYEIDLASRSECHGAMQDSLLLAEVYPLLKLKQVKLNANC
jgi:DNA polymerase III epsilon subunit family exonuclease